MYLKKESIERMEWVAYAFDHWELIAWLKPPVTIVSSTCVATIKIHDGRWHGSYYLNSVVGSAPYGELNNIGKWCQGHVQRLLGYNPV